MNIAITVVWLVAYGLTAAVGLLIVREIDGRWWKIVGSALLTTYGCFFLLIPFFWIFSQVDGSEGRQRETTCHRFPSQRSAQAFFGEFRYDDAVDVSGLDPDGDGIVCEDGPFLSTSRFESRFGDVYYIYEREE